MTLVRLEPAALWSRVKHSTTEPLRSLYHIISYKSLAWIKLRHCILAQNLNVRFCVITWLHPTSKGGTLILSYIRSLGSIFGVKHFEFQYFHIFCVFRKNDIVFGYEDFVDIFWGPSQNWTIFRGHFYAFYGLFFRSRYRMGGGIFFGAAKIS